MMEGKKNDGGKDPWHLLPFDAIRCIVKVLAFGAKKYDERNWEKGIRWSRVYSALLRHLTAWWQGEKVDPETGYSHLWHAGCCTLFLLTYELRGLGEDDRPKAGGEVKSKYTCDTSQLGIWWYARVYERRNVAGGYAWVTRLYETEKMALEAASEWVTEQEKKHAA